MSRRLAVLTMADTDGWSIDADLAFPPLRELGWQPEWLPWRSGAVNWGVYDAVYIGTPWDYPEDPEGFMSLLDTIDRSGAVLVNDIELVRWTMPKTYLRDLEQRGAAIVPSLWRERFAADELDTFFDRFGSDRIIVKPVVSTNATDTFLLQRPVADELVRDLERIFERRELVAQPFMPAILGEGEFSLFYLGGRYSHAILKTPKACDFRVQEEYGARVDAVEPSPALLETADHVLGLVDPEPVYARCDFVRSPGDRFLLMELEVIEPSLYLRLDEASPERFARAFDEYVRQKESEKRTVS